VYVTVSPAMWAAKLPAPPVAAASPKTNSGNPCINAEAGVGAGAKNDSLAVSASGVPMDAATGKSCAVSLATQTSTGSTLYNSNTSTSDSGNDSASANDALFSLYGFSAHAGPLPVNVTTTHINDLQNNIVTPSQSSVPAYHHPGPLFCGPGCRAAALSSHLSLLLGGLTLPCSQSVSTDATALAPAAPVLTPAAAAAVSQLAVFVTSNQWLTGLRVARLVATVISRLRAFDRAQQQCRAKQWWQGLSDDAWRAALAPLDSFERSVYSAQSVDDQGDDEDAEGVTSEKELITELHTILCDLIDAVYSGNESNCDVNASSVLLPFELLDVLAGMLTHNTQHIELPTVAELESHNLRAGAIINSAHGKTNCSSAALTADAASAAASAAVNTVCPRPLPQLAAVQPHAIPLPSALVCGMFPWHAQLNHSCRPNASITGASALLPLGDSDGGAPDAKSLAAALATAAAATGSASAAGLAAHQQHQRARLMRSLLPRAAASCVVVVCQRAVLVGDEITISYAGELTPEPDLNLHAERDRCATALKQLSTAGAAETTTTMTETAATTVHTAKSVAAAKGKGKGKGKGGKGPDSDGDDDDIFGPPSGLTSTDPVTAARALLSAVSAGDAKQETELGQEIQNRFSWQCRCAICEARGVVAAAAAAATAAKGKGKQQRR